jgi:hypothetical protein
LPSPALPDAPPRPANRPLGPRQAAIRWRLFLCSLVGHRDLRGPVIAAYSVGIA